MQKNTQTTKTNQPTNQVTTTKNPSQQPKQADISHFVLYPSDMQVHHILNRGEHHWNWVFVFLKKYPIFIMFNYIFTGTYTIHMRMFIIYSNLTASLFEIFNT